ncbi:MAG: beta-1,6-glucan synthase, partial [Methylophilaceae bacterium]
MQIKVTKAKWLYGLINVLLLALLSFWLYQKNQTINIVSPQLEQNKLQCVYYAPFYKKGDSPLVEG